MVAISVRNLNRKECNINKMYFLLSTINAYLPLLSNEYTPVPELKDVIVISPNIRWTFFGACAPRLTDDIHSVWV
jgi:urate oxidase